ncbi:MAG: diacylglycerol/polyprenol kinase family protein [Candidatus Saccharimonadales bacterium]
MPLVFTVVIVFVLLFLNELWWRTHTVHSELSRKFIHVSVGTFVAFWPFFLSWREIQILSLAFLVIVALSKYLNIFQAIHSVTRPTWGEVFFAVAVGLTALITQDKWIYTAALLQMSLADGLAAIIGTRFGNKQKYAVFGYTKSIVGTLTFFIVSFSILIVYSYYATSSLPLSWIVGISAVASIIENLAIRGLDNLFVPVAVALLITYR